MIDAQRLEASLEDELRAAGNPERAAKERAYLKSDLSFYGAGMPAVRAAAAMVRREHAGLQHDELVTLVDALWQRPVYEPRALAVVLLESHGQLLVPADLPLLERLLRESRTWALLDGLAVNVVGPLVDRYPREVDAVLRRWAVDSDFWLRRTSLLAHLRALRRGEEDAFVRFGEFADGMLDEKEFFVRKAIGWVLRETSKPHPDLVRDWLIPRADRASGVTVREAVKYLPAGDRARVEAARRH